MRVDVENASLSPRTSPDIVVRPRVAVLNPFLAKQIDITVMNNQQRANAILKGIPDLLSWRKDNQFILEALDWIHREQALLLVQKAFAAIEITDPKSGSQLRNLLEGLPYENSTRFLTAPETFHRASQSSTVQKEQTDFYRRALEAEIQLCFKRPYDFELWTGLGDYGFINTTSRAERCQVVRAPRIASQIPVDFKSPLARTANFVTRDKFEEYSPEEIAVIVAKLDDGLHKVDHINTAPLAMIKHCVKVVVIRRVSRRLQWGSSSGSSHIGRIGLCNPEMANLCEIVSGFIHEATHQILNILELLTPFVLPEASASQIVSPWTGNVLRLQNYLHACFVWYALANFWTAALQTNQFSRELAQAELLRSTSGFRQNPMDSVRPFETFIHHGVLTVASLTFEAVRRF